LVYDIFKDPIGLESFSIILGSIAFYFQLYGDFSGYTDIAIGAALILGFKTNWIFKNIIYQWSYIIRKKHFF